MAYMQHLHPLASLLFFFSYMKYFGLPLLALGALTALLWFVPDILAIEMTNRGAQAAFLAYLFLLLAIGVYAVAWIVSRSYKFELTADAFQKEYGVIFKHYVAIPYEQVQNVDITRSLLERLLGLSHLMVQTAGSERVAAEGVLPGIGRAEAVRLRDELLQRMEASQSAPPPATPEAPKAADASAEG